MLHFLLYGTLTALALRVLGKHSSPVGSALGLVEGNSDRSSRCRRLQRHSLRLPIDAYVFSFLPIPARLPLILAIACGTLPYFVTDEWLTRGRNSRRGAYALTKFCFLVSLAIAVALNPMKLFFLVIIVPAILLMFLAFGLVSRWSYAATRHPLPGALASAAVFAWGIAVTFPMIVR